MPPYSPFNLRKKDGSFDSALFVNVGLKFEQEIDGLTVAQVLGIEFAHDVRDGPDELAISFNLFHRECAHSSRAKQAPCQSNVNPM